jgi:hypothetical protein
VQLGGVAPGVAAEQPDLSRVGPQEAEDDPDGGGLAGAVGAEEAVHLAGGDGEVEPVERPRPPEGLDQTRDGDRGVVHGRERTLVLQTCEE